MSASHLDPVAAFSETAFEHLEFLREYAGVLQDEYPSPGVLEQLDGSARALAEGAAQSGLPLFGEIAGKLAHLFHYAMTSTLAAEASGPMVEFVADAVAILETNLLLLSAQGVEAAEDIQAFKEKYPFAFAASVPEAEPAVPESSVENHTAEAAAPLEHPPCVAESLPPDGDVPEDILEFFVPEAEEHLQTVTECLLALETNPNADEIHKLFRAMHTVKGSAAQVGLQRIAHIAHHAEELIGRLREGTLHPSAEIVDLCLESVDALKKILYRQWPDEATVQASVGLLLARIARLAPADGAEAPAAPESSDAGETADSAAQIAEMPDSAPNTVLSTAGPANEFEPVPAAHGPAGGAEYAPVSSQSKETGATPQSKSVRVPLERLDHMMNAVGELVTNRTRMLGRLGELGQLAEVLNFSKARLSDKISEFQDRYEFTQLTGNLPVAPAAGFRPALTAGFSLTARYSDSPHSEFSELELDRYDDFNILSRSLTEISADLTEVLTQLDRFVRQVDSDMDEFTKLAHRLQDEITQARMVPIGNLYTRLSRTARDAAKAAGRQIELQLEGAETELDNGIIQQISDPLIHLVRNAVAHGIETSEERVACGKPAQGRLAVRAYHRGNQIFVETEDDGAGIDYEKVRATAIAQGLVRPEDAGRLSEREWLEFLFRPGFSTASRKTELSGRGVGLDVVQANLAALNGEISVESEKGSGTRFTLKVPLTLIITQALFLRCGDAVFGIPLSYVEEVRRLRAGDIEEVGGKLLTRVRDVVTEIVRLDTQLGLQRVEPVNGFYRLVIVSVGGRQIGLVIEEVLRKDEIVIKGLGEYLRNVKLFPGATVAPDGSLILLIDVNRLVADEAQSQRFGPAASLPQSASPAGEAVEPPTAKKTVLLVDDSISVRRFVGRMLERAGYGVRYASDGLEALETAPQEGCDLILTDLEMPRTNGYELMAHLRQNPATRRIPVVVVTSRAGAKHREKALREGAAGFLTKPVQEDQLLATLAQLLGEKESEARIAAAGAAEAQS